MCLYDPDSNQLRMHALDFPSNPDLVKTAAPIPLEGTANGLTFRTRLEMAVPKSSDRAGRFGRARGRGAPLEPSYSERAPNETMRRKFIESEVGQRIDRLSH